MSEEVLKIDSYASDTRAINLSNENEHLASNNPYETGVTSDGRGKRLDRYLTFLPMIAFCSTLQASWESLGGGIGAGLLNGGPVSLVYGFFLATLGSMAMAASIAEMASIVPVAGAQYHWTAEFAPFAPKFFSLMQGWTTIFAWIATATVAPYFVATQIQGVVVINYPDYVYERYHATLIMWAVIALPLVANVWGRRMLAPLEIIGGIWHMVTLPVLMVVLICLAPINSNEFVWTKTVTGISGWTDPGICFSIGMLSTAFPFVGFDGVLHMAEETKEAPKTVPRSMVMAVATNSVLAFGWLITLLYTMGDDIDSLLSSPTGYPIMQIYLNTVKSPSGAAALMSLGIVTGIIALFSTLASVSRLVWAFARDGGLPFSNFFLQVHPTLRIPIRSLTLVVTLMVLLSLIQIGNTTAFNALLSLSTLALYISYEIPIAFFLLKKLRGHNIPYGPWRMSQPFDIIVNIFSLIYGMYIIIFLPFPSILPVTAANMNYAGPVMLAVFAIGFMDWLISGRTRWLGPVTKYEGEEDEYQFDAREMVNE